MTTESDSKMLGITILDLHDKPTVRDVDLGRRLGLEPPLSIRRIIRRHIEELQEYGVIHAMRAASIPPDADPEDLTEYHLTEPQALCLCQLSPAPQAAGMADVITGPCSFPYLCPDTTRFDWHGRSIDTNLSRLDASRDVVALLPDGTIDIVRLAGPPYGIGGRQGITKRYLNPDTEALTPVMVIILGAIASDRRSH